MWAHGAAQVHWRFRVPLARVATISLASTSDTDAVLAKLRIPTDVVRLDLNGSAVTDNGLARVGDIWVCGGLELSRTAVTDAGMVMSPHSLV